jgi:hypothetical protein
MSFSSADRRDRREQPRARAAIPFETAAPFPPSGSVELREEHLPDGPAPTSLVIGDIIEAAIAGCPGTNPEVGC